MAEHQMTNSPFIFDKPTPRIKLYSRELLYTQEPDTWDSGQDDQELRIKSQDSGSGNYITIETKRWALDREDLPAFCDMLLKTLEDLE